MVGTPKSPTAPAPAEVAVEASTIRFEASVSDASDLATDLSIEWLVDGNSLGITSADSSGISSTSTSTLTSGLHTLSASVTDTDSLSSTATLDFVVDGLPSSPTVVITPSAASTEDNITATASGSVDPEGMPVSYSFDWLKNGQNSGFTSATISASETLKDDIWTVRVTPSDGSYSGPFAEASIHQISAKREQCHISPSPASMTLADLQWQHQRSGWQPHNHHHWVNLSTGQHSAQQTPLTFPATPFCHDQIKRTISAIDQTVPLNSKRHREHRHRPQALAV